MATMSLATSRILTTAERTKRQTYETLMKMFRYEHHVPSCPSQNYIALDGGYYEHDVFDKDCVERTSSPANIRRSVAARESTPS